MKGLAELIATALCLALGLWLGSALGQSSIISACDKDGRFAIQHRLLVPGKFDCVRSRA
jgi:hypothetical protein